MNDVELFVMWPCGVRQSNLRATFFKRARAASSGSALTMLICISLAGCRDDQTTQGRPVNQQPAGQQIAAPERAHPTLSAVFTGPDRTRCAAEAERFEQAVQAFETGNLPDALDRYQDTLGMLARSPAVAPGDQADCYAAIAVTLNALKRYEESVVWCEKALAVYSALPEAARKEATCRMVLALALGRLARYGEAFDALTEATAIFSQIPDAGIVGASCEGNLGTALIDLGRFEEGIDRLKKACHALANMSSLPESHRQPLQLVFQLNIAEALRRLGRYEEAIRIIRSARATFATIPDTDSYQALCAAIEGMILCDQGQYREAIDILRTARKTHHSWQLYETLARAAEQEAGLLGLSLAIHYQSRALSIAGGQRMDIRAPQNQIAVFEDMAALNENGARLYLRLDDYLRRLDSSPDAAGDVADAPTPYLGTQPHFDDAIVGVFPALYPWANPEQAAEAALYLADQGKAATLRELLIRRVVTEVDQQMLELMSQHDRLEYEIGELADVTGWGDRGESREGLSDQDRFAIGTAESAVVNEKIRLRDEIEAQLRRSPAASIIEPALLKPAEFGQTLQPGEACVEYVACEKELLILLATDQGVRAFRHEIPRDAPRTLYENGKLSVEKLLVAYRQSPENPESLGLEGLVWLQREWMDHFEAKKRLLSETEHVAVSRALAHVLLPDDLRQVLAAERTRHIVIVPSRVLAFTSFATLIIGAKQGDSAPQSLADSRFLVEDYSVSYIQSLSLLDPIRKRVAEKRQKKGQPKGEFLAFADPVHDDNDQRASGQDIDLRVPQGELDRTGADAVVRAVVRDVDIRPDARRDIRWMQLPETRREAESAASLFGAYQTYEQPILQLASDPPPPTGAVCVGFAANRSLVKSPEIGCYRHLLFSVHGYTNVTDPWLSALMLTDLAAKSGTRQPAPLTMADVFAMHLQADTVVLAACQTALGQMRAGEGVVGFQLAFLFAGADSVVLTQWKVPSAIEGNPGSATAYPTTNVINRFYRDLRLGNVARAEALRQGQLAVLRQGGQLADPFYWGAWQLFGEWRASEALQEQRLGPCPSDIWQTTCYSGTTGCRIAWVVRTVNADYVADRRYVVVVDGQQGEELELVPRFELHEFTPPNIRRIVPQFSPDGTQVAYAASPVPVGTTSRLQDLCPSAILWPAQVLAADGFLVAGPSWSPGGQLAYVLRTQEGSLAAVLPHQSQPAVFELHAPGIPSRHASYFSDVIISPDGTQVAYVAWTENGSWGVFLNGKCVSPDCNEIGDVLFFSPDSKHLAWTARVPGSNADGQDIWQLFLDGQLVPHKYDASTDVAFSPNSQRIMYVGRQRDPGSATSYVQGSFKSAFLVVDRQIGPEYEDVQRAAFSPDSQRVIYAAKSGGSWRVILDGQTGPDYDDVLCPTFSLDSQRTAYWARKGSDWQLVVDASIVAHSKEAGRLTFSPDSKRLAYAMHDGEKWQAVVDGQTLGEYDEIPDNGLVFNADGTRLAVLGRSAEKWEVSVNSQPGPAYDQVPCGPVFRGDGVPEYLAIKNNMLFRVSGTPRTSKSPTTE